MMPDDEPGSGALPSPVGGDLAWCVLAISLVAVGFLAAVTDRRDPGVLPSDDTAIQQNKAGLSRRDNEPTLSHNLRSVPLNSDDLMGLVDIKAYKYQYEVDGQRPFDGYFWAEERTRDESGEFGPKLSIHVVREVNPRGNVTLLIPSRAQPRWAFRWGDGQPFSDAEENRQFSPSKPYQYWSATTLGILTVGHAEELGFFEIGESSPETGRLRKGTNFRFSIAVVPAGQCFHFKEQGEFARFEPVPVPADEEPDHD